MTKITVSHGNVSKTINQPSLIWLRETDSSSQPTAVKPANHFSGLLQSILPAMNLPPLFAGLLSRELDANELRQRLTQPMISSKASHNIWPDTTSKTVCPV